jgi:hypothetical protein
MHEQKAVTARIRTTHRSSATRIGRSPGAGDLKIGTWRCSSFEMLREKLLTDKGLAKQYLRILVTEIQLNGDTLRMTGSYAALAAALAQSNTGTHDLVLSFDPKWLPEQGLNLRPAD